MSANSYIQVIVPLKLDWEPFYSVPEGLELVEGDRVNVLFSGKEYMAVVSKINAMPDDALLNKGVHSIIDKVADLPRITALEIRFWRTLAAYYLCTVGEVYKSVYYLDKPLPRKWTEKLRDTIAAEMYDDGVDDKILEAFKQKKTILLRGGDSRTELYLKLAIKAIKSGKSVLYLVPDIAFTQSLEQYVSSVFPEVMVFSSAITPARKRDIVIEARSGKPMIVLGTKNALWIPFGNLGLIIVDDEHDSSYKQDSPAPRFHTRESAIMLGATCSANVVLGSATPSLESLYNSETGLFVRFDLPDNGNDHSVSVIDLVAEKRKRAVSGSFSFKLLAHLQSVEESGGKVLLICPAKGAIQECAQELEAIIPGAVNKTVFITSPFGIKSLPSGEYSLIAILNSDSLIGREDFRSDEYALQQFHHLSTLTPLLILQTREPSHPVFSLQNGAESMLNERRSFGYPPYTRLVQIDMEDANENRRKLRTRFMVNRLKEVLRPFSDPVIIGSDAGRVRIFFKRDKNLVKGKVALRNEVCKFEQQYGCAGHIVIDVDPV